MAIPTGSFLDAQSQAIEEVLDKDVELLMPKHDPFFSKVVQGTAEGSGPWGRDLRIRKTWYSGYTGVIDQGASTSDFGLYGDTDGSGAFGDSDVAKLHTQSLSNTWPDPLLGKSQRPIRLNVGLRSSLTNLYWSLGEMQAEATPAYIAGDLSLKMKGFANNVAHTHANYLWLSQNDNYRICTITTGDFTLTDDDYSTDNTDDRILAIEPSNLACDRLHVGMRVNLVDAAEANDPLRTSGGAGGGTTEIIVVNVDSIVNKVYLRWADGAAWDQGVSGSNKNFEVGDYLVFPGSREGNDSFKGFAGMNSWIKTGTETGTNATKLLGAESTEFGGTDEVIDVLVHPEFRSGGWDFGNRPLTERRLRQIIRRFISAKGKYGHTIDSFFASDGVWMAYERQWSGKEMIDRTGRIATVQTGQGLAGNPYDGMMSITVDGRTIKGYSCCNIDANTVYGTKTADGNWKMYSPPDYSGLKSDSTIGGKYAAFRFIGPSINGDGSVKFPLFDSSGTGNYSMVTEGIQTPGMIRQQLVPDQPVGIKLTNVEEDRLYADLT